MSLSQALVSAHINNSFLLLKLYTKNLLYSGICFFVFEFVYQCILFHSSNLRLDMILYINSPEPRRCISNRLLRLSCCQMTVNKNLFHVLRFLSNFGLSGSKTYLWSGASRNSVMVIKDCFKASLLSMALTFPFRCTFI